MARQNVNVGTLANDRNGDTLRTINTKNNATFVEIYLKLGGDSDQLMSAIQFTDSAIEFGTTNIMKLVANVATAARTITFPDASGTLVLDSDTGTLLNKTLKNPDLILPRVYDSDSDNYGTLKFAGNLDSNKSIVFPLLTNDSDTVVFENQNQTLINKTLTNPTLTEPVIESGLDDANGAFMFKFTPTANAQNWFEVANADSATLNPLLSVVGTDSDISLRLNAKNGGSVRASKISYRGQTITGDATVSRSRTAVDINSGVAVAITLNDGVVDFERKIFMNRGAGTATVTPTNFAQGTSFALAQNEGCEVIWNGSNWFITGNQSVVTIT